MSLLALAVAGFAALLSGVQTCEISRSRKAAEDSAAYAKGSLAQAVALTRLTADSVAAAKSAAEAAQRSASAAAAQAQAAITQANASSESARSARTANALSQESVRARLVVRGASLRAAVKVGEPVVGDLHVENVGHAEATEAKIRSIFALMNRLPDGALPPFGQPTAQSVAVIGPNNVSKSEMRLDGAAITADVMSRLDSGALHLYVYGTVTYSTFGKLHRTDFCYSPDPKDPSTSLICGKWNRTK